MDMNNTKQSSVARAVISFSKEAIACATEQQDNSMMLSLIAIWERSVPSERGVIGRKILSILNRNQLSDPIVVREVLALVGTPVCECESSQAWYAVTKYANQDQLLSVRQAAVEAGLRLIDKGERPDDAEVQSILNQCASLAATSFAEVAESAVQLAEQLG
jgi:hypothetical protein